MNGWQDVVAENKMKQRAEYLKGHIDDLGYMLQRVTVRRQGNIFVGKCPFHNEKTGSFVIYPKGYTQYGKKQDYSSFFCFGCKKGGDVIEFRRLYDKLEEREDACIAFEKEYGINIDDENLQNILLKEQIENCKKNQAEHLSFSDIALIYSSICRNYLLWIKEKFPNNLEIEFEEIQKLYLDYDMTILDKNIIQAEKMIYDLQFFIEDKKNKLINKI